MTITLEDWDAKRLDRILGMIGEDFVASGKVAMIDPNKVLAHAWQPRRLVRCREELAAGRCAPAIDVVGYRIGRQTLYGVSDGMHRTIAAREAGRRIKAEISGFYAISLDAWIIWYGALWRRENGNLRRVGIGPLTSDVVEDLRRLGIQERK